MFLVIVSNSIHVHKERVIEMCYILSFLSFVSMSQMNAFACTRHICKQHTLMRAYICIHICIYTCADYSDNSNLCVTASLYKAHCFHVGCSIYPLVKSAQFSLFSICHCFLSLFVSCSFVDLSLNRIAKWRALQFGHFKLAYKSFYRITEAIEFSSCLELRAVHFATRSHIQNILVNNTYMWTLLCVLVWIGPNTERCAGTGSSKYIFIRVQCSTCGTALISQCFLTHT